MSKASLLLLPGNMCDARLWAGLQARLAQAGHDSRVGDLSRQSTIADMAADMLDETPGVVIPVGFSMGAIVALEMMRQAPARLAAIGLLALNASADLPERAAVRPRQQSDVRSGGLAEVVADELKPHYLAQAQAQDSALRALVLDMALGLGPDVFVRQSEALRTRADLRPVLGGITRPAFVACGDEDRLCSPEWHRDWAARIGPAASLHVIPNAGHLLPLEQPDALADALIAWLHKEQLP
ncbi:alpha/beta fold hydrolase [Sphingobium algorifonticola]|uniref:Alpha/beta hydrolase n=1 Tax=Sphingobium algorifonticola TaxID=2008318 RepID=A0A437J921_9SPHN|nr:alpha/beta hydrolase [Sphingobium algorifonticola]RVT41997.1 alpha/beta hydrolase [Sphingobium algorifonticola]